MGAAIHAAWVWQMESGYGKSVGKRKGERLELLRDLAEPFTTPDRAKKRTPNPEARAVYEGLRRTYQALSRRVRGREGEDPFLLRQEMVDPV